MTSELYPLLLYCDILCARRQKSRVSYNVSLPGYVQHECCNLEWFQSDYRSFRQNFREQRSNLKEVAVLEPVSPKGKVIWPFVPLHSAAMLFEGLSHLT